MLATDRQLQHLSRSGQWFMDGTFKIVKRPFHQLLINHAFVRAGSNFKLMPLVFVIMSRRQTSEYVEVLKKLLELLPNDPQVKTIILYFEQAAWKAISKTLPEAHICGCLFHLTQAVWRKCQEIGLQVAYMEDDAIHKFVRKIMALPFVPAAAITRMFLRITERVPATGKLRDLINYFQALWIAHLTFSPRSWSVFNIAVRTNNFVEGWHRHFNNKVSEQSLGIYRLIPELFHEASLLPLQSRLIQEGRLRAYVRKSSTSRQEEILDIW
ncbi:uncharacterized protein LOC124138963 [Haliotis rufescens]|uniref:uncharacterized protein LOC124138963 n=1 Tax=Haliotis rufescens TaxID=6454 RepID=UPI00201F16A8|nr:uncharacterized protein LOC124138963 [Haliotis rufescens]